MPWPAALSLSVLVAVAFLFVMAHAEQVSNARHSERMHGMARLPRDNRTTDYILAEYERRMQAPKRTIKRWRDA